VLGRPGDQVTWGAELLGTGLRAGTYASLLWNGSRLHRASDGGPSATLPDALALLALTCGLAPGSALVDAAVRAGEAEAELAAAAVRSATDSRTGGPPVAEVTSLVLPAAACAWVCSEGSDVGVSAAMDQGLRDLAAALLVVRAPSAGSPTDEPPGDDVLLGHALAAGWLATRLAASGVVGAPGSWERTLATVVGAP